MSTDEQLALMFELEQARNIAFLEDGKDELPKVEGVPLILGLNYELVQFLNMMTLQEAGIIGDKKEPEKESTSV